MVLNEAKEAQCQSIRISYVLSCLFLVARSLLRPAHHPQLHDRQDLDVVAALAGRQAQTEEHQVRGDQGLVGGQDGRGREEEGAGEAGQAEGRGCQRTGGLIILSRHLRTFWLF